MRLLGFPGHLCLLIIIGLNGAGSISVSAATQATRPRQATTTTPSQSNHQRPVKRGPLTVKEQREAEQRLADLGYWTGKIDGQWDETSRYALMAFQKVEGLKRTGQLTRADFEVLRHAERPSPLEASPAHVEVDLVRQVLFLVGEDGQVSRILPVSTGSGKEFISEGWARDAVTPPGRYSIYMKVDGWKKSPLGRMYYPNYFMVGTAIHGYPSVPAKPASHGCVRIPMFAAKEFSEMMPIGMGVLIHRGVIPAPLTPLADQSKD